MKAVIIEDEQINAQELMKKISTVADDVEVITVLPSVKMAKRWLMNNSQPDLVFMDIQLSDGVSFEILDEYKLTCPIVFTTAYDEYALRAFKVNSVDYLLKPVNPEELKNAIARCRRLLREEQKLPPDWNEVMKLLSHKDSKPLYKEKFVVNHRQQWVPVPTSDIALFTRDNINYIITFKEEKFFLDYDSLEEVEEIVNPRHFFRANRQCIVNMQVIQSIRPLDNGKLVLTLKAPFKQQVEVSREKAPAFKKWFDI